MTVRIYKSSDASAPTLTGSVGALITVLDACLVNGYGSKTAAGWTKAFSGTNKAAYLQNTTGSNNPSGMYLYVADDATAGGGAKEARLCGFETMSAITPTGTGQFPTSGQAGSITGGYVNIRKSATADTTTRSWTLIANGQSFYLITEAADWTAPLACPAFFFGDIKSYKASDPYAVAIVGRYAENTPNAANAECFTALSDSANNALSGSLIGHFMARRHTGIGGSVRFGKTIDRGKCYNLNGGFYSSESQTAGTFSNLFIGRYNITYPWQFPNPTDGALWLSPVYVCHEGVLRGYLPGLWAPLHDRPFAHNDTVTISSGNLSGKSLISQKILCSVTGNGDDACVLFEYSDTWS